MSREYKIGDEYDVELSVVERAAAIVQRIDRETRVSVIDSNTVRSVITVLCELIVQQQQRIEELDGRISAVNRKTINRDK